MDRSPSSRFLGASLGMMVAGVAMFAAAVATGAASGPKILSGTFMLLIVLCAVIGSIFGLVARSKGRAEIEQIKVQAAARLRKDSH